MKIIELTEKLDNFFEIDRYKDSWDFSDKSIQYLYKPFLVNNIGLMIKNSENILTVYTSTFPDEVVLDKMIKNNYKNSLLFTHHPKVWDPTLLGSPYREFDFKFYELLKGQGISIYALHTPLDKNGTYSTSVNLAKVLGLEIEKDFYQSNGIYKGVLCKTDFIELNDLIQYIEDKIGHKIGLINNGDKKINNGKICIVAGGGAISSIINDMNEYGVNTYFTGAAISRPEFRDSVKFNENARTSKINVLLGSHYTTEKYACIEMKSFFKQLHLDSFFIEGKMYSEDFLSQT